MNQLSDQKARQEGRGNQREREREIAIRTIFLLFKKHLLTLLYSLLYFKFFNFSLIE